MCRGNCGANQIFNRYALADLRSYLCNYRNDCGNKCLTQRTYSVEASLFKILSQI